jgi:hypothetical protein
MSTKHLFTGNPYPAHTVHLPNIKDGIAQFVRGEYETESDLERDDLLWCIARGYVTAEYVSKETRASEVKSKQEWNDAVARAEARRKAKGKANAAGPAPLPATAQTQAEEDAEVDAILANVQREVHQPVVRDALCTATRLDGQPCRAVARTEDGLCMAHAKMAQKQQETA